MATTRISTPDGIWTIETRQDIRTLWHDVLLDGSQCGSFHSREEALRYIFPEWEEEEDYPTMPCGCSEYHMADCPLLSPPSEGEYYQDDFYGD